MGLRRFRHGTTGSFYDLHRTVFSTHDTYNTHIMGLVVFRLHCMDLFGIGASHDGVPTTAWLSFYATTEHEFDTPSIDG
jgi:hypothetical protein